ncbi:hypothetical protein EDD29_0093 [Actinocorallia herbida]|uniref:Uncharacterized protein n=1 Tax=Actinocorallia herbida TaxID=58109 RepID=A0A3N1CMS8_9ACTN|nr:hypothetical protein [Actinocorallia herbida]ROO82612.1 hypothetical protein EDD29_0093 [Actinocorallia herbida]
MIPNIDDLVRTVDDKIGEVPAADLVVSGGLTGGGSISSRPRRLERVETIAYYDDGTREEVTFVHPRCVELEYGMEEDFYDMSSIGSVYGEPIRMRQSMAVLRVEGYVGGYTSHRSGRWR